MHKATFAALALAVANCAFAQTDAPPLTRSDVKSETRTLEKQGKLSRAGEAATRGSDWSSKSNRTRADRKAETRLAAKNHELAPPGPAAGLKADNALRAQRSTKTRGERKAETRLAAKEHKLAPAGEAADARR